MPDGVGEGMLETLCLASVSSDPAMACVDSYFECLEHASIRPSNRDKARIHAWLASREKPDTRVGEAAAAGYWNFADAAFARLWQFLREYNAKSERTSSDVV